MCQRNKNLCPQAGEMAWYYIKPGTAKHTIIPVHRRKDNQKVQDHPRPQDQELEIQASLRQNKTASNTNDLSEPATLFTGPT